MKLNIYIGKLIILIFALFSIHGNSQNLLTNGDFETGTVFGFKSNGEGYVRIQPPFQ